MYTIHEISIDEVDYSNYECTVFSTKEWLNFLSENQKAQPVILELWNNGNVDAYFFGGIIQKFGIKILGSPFNGWLTPDMGFSVRNGIVFDYHAAIIDVVNYSFKSLKCLLVQILDNSIQSADGFQDFYFEESNLLYIDGHKTIEEILEAFSKNGRRDVRASGRKGLVFKKVPFDRKFVEEYYAQLIDVFAKQNLKPSYGIDKMYDLVKAYEMNPDNVLALEAIFQDKCIATVFSFGYKDWAYYIGAASFREYQKYLPNEGLFWEHVKYWREKGVCNFDLVGYREYKMKYNPEIIKVPVFVFSKYRILVYGKNIAKKIIKSIRKLQGI